MQVVQVMLWYLDSGCSKHMTGNRSKLMNFVEKFIGSVRFGNDHLGAIMGYGDDVRVKCNIRVYRRGGTWTQSILYILKGSRSTNLYTISMDEMMKSSPICLLSKASKSKSWLWHRRLNHLNFGTINDLASEKICTVQDDDILESSPCFFWAEAVATACYTQNRSLIHTRHNKTPYELVHEKKPDLTFFRVFGALCYPTNDSENLGKFQAKAPSRKGYRIYNKRTRRLMETIHVTFDEMHQSMAPVRISSGPSLSS
ncbi:integrase, catalytic region, zinc finger, CCHC-type containing protein [Tanacetum coccineum]